MYKAIRLVREVLRRRGPGLSVVSSQLFLALGVAPPGGSGYVVDYYGLQTEVRLVADVLYVRDQVEQLPKELSDRAVVNWLRAAEATFAKKGVVPHEEPSAAVEILRDKATKKLADFAPVVYRYFYDYGTVAAILMASEHFGITDVMITEQSNYVVAESYRHGLLKTNIELSMEDRRTLQDRVSVRVGSLSAYNPFVSKYDRWHQARVTAIAPDVAPMPSFAFRMLKTMWLPSNFVAAGGAEPWQMAYLCAMWRRRFVILAAGLPGSGKTSLINAVMACTPPERRLAIVQSVPELRVPQAAFTAIERTAFGAGVQEILMSQLVQRFGLRANSEVAINELLTETDVRAFVTVVYAGFGAAATIHAQDARELLLRLERLGVTPAELAALKPKLIIPVMSRVGGRRYVAAIWEPRWRCSCGAVNRPTFDRCAKCGKPKTEEVVYVTLSREEALEDPEVAKWAKVIEDAASNQATHNPQGWLAVLSSLSSTS